MSIKGMGHDVFISHSATDKEIANSIAATLEGGGIQCWVAPRDIRPGDTWGGSILKAIQSSKLMVIIFSTKSNESQQVMREVELAVQKNVVVLPFRVEDIEPSNDMKYFLSATHWLDALSADLDNHLEHLLESARSILGKGKDADSQDAPIHKEVESQNTTEHNERTVKARVGNVSENEPDHGTARPATPSRGSGRRTEPRLEPSLGLGREPDMPGPVETSSSSDEALSDDIQVNETPQGDIAQTRLLEEADLNEAGVVVDGLTGKQSKEMNTVPDTANSTEVKEGEGIEPVGKTPREKPKSSSSNPLHIVFGVLALCAIGFGVWFYFAPSSEPIATVIDDPSDNPVLEQPAKGDKRAFEAEAEREVDTPSSLSQSQKQDLTEKPKNEPSSEPYKDAPVVITQRVDPKSPPLELDKSAPVKEQTSKKSNTTTPIANVETTADSDEPVQDVVSKERVEIEETVKAEQTVSLDTEGEISDMASSEPLDSKQPDVEPQESKPLFDSNDLAAELERETQELEKMAKMGSDKAIESLPEPAATVLPDPVSTERSESDVLLDGLSAESQTAEPNQKLASEMSLEELRLAAEGGDPLAQHLLGTRYEKGKGVTQSDLDAVKWYKMSAAQGNADSQHSLGIMYELGVGVSQNESEAEKWYRLASDQGNSEAQRYLNEMLERQGR